MGFTKLFKQVDWSIVGRIGSHTLNIPWKDRDGTDQSYVYISPAPTYQNVIFAAVSSSSASVSISTSSTSEYFTFLGIGSGDRPFADDDYNLDSRITSGYSVVAAHNDDTYNTITGKTERSASFTITASADITIKEIGIFKYVYTAASTGRLALLYREVLNTPISLANGQTITLLLTIAGG